MNVRMVSANVILRLLMVVVFLPHAIGKFQYHATFESKFGLSTTVTYLTGAAEILSVIGAAVTLILLAFYAPRFAKTTWVLTALTVLAIWIVQIGAIVVARWPAWLDYASGMEYNVTLLVASGAVLLLTPWPSSARK